VAFAIRSNFESSGLPRAEQGRRALELQQDLLEAVLRSRTALHEVQSR
jgi:hypothetical protein